MKTASKAISLFPGTASLLGLAALASATPAIAATVFTWGGTDYVAGGQHNMQGDTGVYLGGGSDQYGEPDGYPLPSGLVGRAYSSTTAFSPTTGYSGPTFYGGASVTSTNPAANEGFHELAISNGGGGDSIHWRVDSNGADSHSNHAFIYFKQDQFGSGYTGITITSTTLSGLSFQMHTGQISQAGSQDLSMYWVLQDAGQFYVAQTPTLIAQNNPYATAFDDITGWATYDPSAGDGLAALDFDETSTFSPHTFTDVQALGFYIEHEDGASQSHVDIDYFALGDAIPEPSQSLLVIVGLGVVLLRRGKRD